MNVTRPAGLACLCLSVALLSPSAASAQSSLRETLARHGVQVRDRGIEGAFDDGVEPAIAVTPGSFAVPLAMLSSGEGRDRIEAAYAFGVLAGRSGRAAAPAELAAAGQSFIQMMASIDRRTRIAGARVAGRVFAVPLQAAAGTANLPAGMLDAVFAVFNQDHEFDQLAAMDALGLLRATMAVTALTERYAFYRGAGQRALAGGALEALARIGEPSSVELVRQVAGDKWAGGKDSTALAVSFARERLLKDGSLVALQQALDDKSRRAQARGYLIELGVPVP
ncbi:MAG: hypothetical protein ABI665_27145 [Vicinamibacterales bacterium]